jgi:hypothetical protein
VNQWLPNRTRAGSGAKGEGHFRQKEDEQEAGDDNLQCGTDTEVGVVECPARDAKRGSENKGKCGGFADQPMVLEPEHWIAQGHKPQIECAHHYDDFREI